MTYLIFLYLISFIGLFFGIILYKNFKKEVNDGKNYLWLMINILLAVFFAIIISKIEFNIFFISIFIVGLIVSLFYELEYLAVSSLVLINGIDNISTINTGLAFLFGLPYGSLLAMNKRYAHQVIKNTIIFATALIVTILDFYVAILVPISLGIIIGFFTKGIYRKFYNT